MPGRVARSGDDMLETSEETGLAQVVIDMAGRIERHVNGSPDPDAVVAGSDKVAWAALRSHYQPGRLMGVWLFRRSCRWCASLRFAGVPDGVPDRIEVLHHPKVNTRDAAVLQAAILMSDVVPRA